MVGTNRGILDLCCLVESNRKLLNLRYSGVNFEVSSELIDGLNNIDLFIQTNYKKEPSKRVMEKIKNNFQSSDVMYIEGDKEMEPFFSIRISKELG